MSAKRKTAAGHYQDGWRSGLDCAFLRAARIADSHRAMHMNLGHTEAAMAASSVAAFIVQAARECGAWDDSRPQPLVLSDEEARKARGEA